MSKARRGTLVVAALILLVSGCRPAADSDSARTPLPASPGPSAGVFPEADAELDASLRSLLGDDVERLPAATREERAELDRLYAAAGFAPVWIDGTRKPAPQAKEILGLLQRAADDGLDPVDYQVAGSDTLAALSRPSAGEVALYDAGLSLITLRFLRHLHMGRVNPRAVGFMMDVPPDDHDFPSILLAAIAAGRLTETVIGLRPPLGPYGTLRAVLPRYRALAADPTIPPLVLPTGSLHPGDRFEGLPALRRRLIAFGDLGADTLPPGVPDDYDAATVEGVKQFQMRHGLTADGVVGPGTSAALAVPLSWRVRQIELGLERLRWLPHLDDRRLVAVNIPMFRLWAWDTIPAAGIPDLTMGVIVGRAIDTQTPVFVEEMAHAIFRPYWNVPRSIVRSETLPAIDRDPDYLSKNDMEMVRGDGDSSPVVPMSAEAVELLRQGVLRVRQRPGPRNALGLIKFMFPNDENVYMHSTPAQELFSRTRRDFSHGCVRVEDPVALAEWALRDEPGWTETRIVAAMSGLDNRRVDLSERVRVVLFYITAVVMPDDGVLHFADDMYGHDTTLDRALARQIGS